MFLSLGKKLNGWSRLDKNASRNLPKQNAQNYVFVSWKKKLNDGWRRHENNVTRNLPKKKEPKGFFILQKGGRGGEEKRKTEILILFKFIFF